MIRAFETGKDENLQEFGRLLWQRRISHVIRTVGQMQVVAVARPEQLRETLFLYRQWQTGEVQPSAEDSSDVASWFSSEEIHSGLLGAYLRAPLTITLVAVCIVLAVLTLTLGFSGLFNALLFPDFAHGTRTLVANRVLSEFTLTQFFKLFTPIFLHGSYLHLVFNMLYLWIFGKCIEEYQRSWVLAVVIADIALVSNVAQYISSGSIYFVGISGVVAGLLGYIAMWKFIDPRKGITVPASMLVFMTIMIIGMAFVNLDFVADTAHVAGLVTGVLIGLVMASVSRYQRSSREHS